MAITHVQTVTSGIQNGGAFSVNGVTTTGGNLLVASGGGYASATLQNYTVTDNKSNTWTENPSSPLSLSGNNVRHHQRYVPNCTGGSSHNFTQTPASSNAYQTLFISEFSGVSTSTPLDKSAGATGTGTSLSSGTTATRSQADEVLVGSIATGDNQNGANATITAGAGFTIPSGGSNNSFNNLVSAIEYQIVASTGTTAATATIPVSDSWGVILGTYTQAGTVTGRIWKLAGIGGGLAGGSHGLAG